MKESNCGRIPPCYGGKKFRIHEELEKIKAWDETHDMFYELNKQMCDLGKTMNDPMKPLSEEAIQEIAKVLEITRNPKDIMEEKKTIEEWKETFVELYKAMRKDLGASDLDVYVYQNNGKPKVNFDVKF